MRWQVDVPLLTNKYVLFDTLWGCVTVTLVCGALFALLFGWSGGWNGVKAGLLFAGGAGVFLLVISALTLGVFFGNRCPLEFVLSDRGIVMSNVSERARFVHRAAWILALLTGRPLMAGPGLIAQSREIIAIEWEEVTQVRCITEDGVVTVRGGLLDTIRLYCSTGNYEQVAKRIEMEVRQHAPAAVFQQ